MSIQRVCSTPIMTILYMNFSENEKKKNRKMLDYCKTRIPACVWSSILLHAALAHASGKTANALFVTIPVSAQRISFLC